jgi:hypothetical protein
MSKMKKKWYANSSFYRNFDWKVLLSMTALFTSLSALYVSYRQLKIASEEQQAAVFPYLTCSYNDDNHFIEFNIKNDGLGPAFISGVEVRVQDSVYDSFWRPVVNFLKKQENADTVKFTKGELLPGWVVRTGDPYMIFRMERMPERMVDAFWTYYSSMRAKIWYYDIYSQCWMFDTKKIRVERCKTCPNDVLKR